MKSIKNSSNTAMIEWRTIGAALAVFFLQCSQNLHYKNMSMVFVIYCSDIPLFKYKNNDSSSSYTAVRKIAGLAANYLITFQARAPHLQVDK
jgi:hypothetical protein